MSTDGLKCRAFGEDCEFVVNIVGTMGGSHTMWIGIPFVVTGGVAPTVTEETIAILSGFDNSQIIQVRAWYSEEGEGDLPRRINFAPENGALNSWTAGPVSVHGRFRCCIANPEFEE